ncbi:MAG TPA: hypothetical protein DIU15_17800, partial [Deltaproteobacteria bacterium]|nr:hypothetical protein [Deltaproteobacteria bacterium]
TNDDSADNDGTNDDIDDSTNGNDTNDGADDSTDDDNTTDDDTPVDDGTGSDDGDDDDDSIPADASLDPDDGVIDECDRGVEPDDTCYVSRLMLLDGYDGTVYTSVDRGVTWAIAGTAPFAAPAIVALGNLPNGGVMATTTFGDTWVSHNDGVTWSAGATGPWASDAPSGSAAHGVALDASASSLFASSVHYGRDGLLYESTDNGSSWAQVGSWPMQTSLNTDLTVSSTGDAYIGHNPYDGAQIFHYDGTSSVLSNAGSYDASGWGGAANIEMHTNGSLFAAGNPEVTFFSSVDSGTTWGAQGSWNDPRAVGTMADAGSDLYAISVKGPVLRSEDAGQSWQEVGDWGTVATHNVVSSSGWISMVSLP